MAFGSKGDGEASPCPAANSESIGQVAMAERMILRTRSSYCSDERETIGFASGVWRGSMSRVRLPLCLIVAVNCTVVALLGSEAREPDVGFVPTPMAAVDRMIVMAELKPGETVYDLGCGDGRIVVEAARRHGVKAVGVDINPERVEESRAKVQAAGVGHLVTIEQADIFNLDLSDADVVFLYLTPRLNERLMPQLRKLKPGARIVSYEFDMGAAKPVETVRERFDGYGEQRIYKWVVPWEEAETAKWDIFTLEP